MAPKARLDSLEKIQIAFTEKIGLYPESLSCEIHALCGKKEKKRKKERKKNAEKPTVTAVDWMVKTICDGELVWRASG